MGTAEALFSPCHAPLARAFVLPMCRRVPDYLPSHFPSFFTPSHLRQNDASMTLLSLLASLLGERAAFSQISNSGKESLAVNDPVSPRLLVLSNGEEVRQARSPLISTVLKTLMRLIN